MSVTIIANGNEIVQHLGAVVDPPRVQRIDVTNFSSASTYHVDGFIDLIGRFLFPVAHERAGILTTDVGSAIQVVDDGKGCTFEAIIVNRRPVWNSVSRQHQSICEFVCGGKIYTEGRSFVEWLKQYGQWLLEYGE